MRPNDPTNFPNPHQRGPISPRLVEVSELKLLEAMTIEVPEILAKSGFGELAALLQQHGVRFVIVGGAAVAVHGCRDPLSVDDLDILIDPTAVNAERVLASLRSGFLGVPFSAAALAKPRVQLPLKVLHYWGDILTPDTDQEFGGILSRSIPARLGSVSVQVAGRSDLIAMKERAVEREPSDAQKHQHDLTCLKSSH